MTSSNDNGRHYTIAVDTWPLLRRYRKTGIHVYARNLLTHFREMAGHDTVEFRPLVSSRVEDDANDFAPASGFRLYDSSLLRIGRLWRYGGACLSARCSRADVLFCPSGSTFPINALVPVVATIHDVIPVLFPTLPKARTLAFEFSNAARFSRTVITDSQHSKLDLVNIFRIPENKVHVVYLACDPEVFNDHPDDPAVSTSLLKGLGITRPFVLHHGRIQERKNLRRLVEAYNLALSRTPDLEHDLVLVGDLGWQNEEVIAAARANPGRVIFAGAQADPDLAILLKSAALVVIPSLYEGFCLPLLEAMACGAPTICSTASCLPEISGNKLLYFDPASVEEMADRIQHALENSSVREMLARQGKARASEFSWRRCAEETLAVLKAVAN